MQRGVSCELPGHAASGGELAWGFFAYAPLASGQPPLPVPRRSNVVCAVQGSEMELHLTAMAFIASSLTRLNPA